MHKFAGCNHEGQVPRNMGRGASRQTRLVAYFNRKCLDCTIKDNEAYVKGLTISESSGQTVEVILERLNRWSRRNY